MGYSEKSGRKKRMREEHGELAWLVRSCFIGFGVSVAVAAGLWLAASVISYAQNDPDAFVGTLGFAAIYLAALVAGFVSVKINKERALACGALSGFLLALLFFVISLFFSGDYSSNYPFIVGVALRAAMILMSVLGAFAAVHHKKKRRVRGKRS